MFYHGDLKAIFNPILNYYGSKIKVSFDMSCLQTNRFSINHGKIVNIYIVYETINIANINGNRDSNLTIENADVDKYKYTGYGVGGGYGEVVIIFGADMNSSTHFDNKGKDILILGIGPMQGLGEHSLTVEKMYSINFTEDTKKNLFEFALQWSK